ncbi:hypothetical protein KQX54_018636 [Cotesia glomerata]|uniref:Uncharacterized protein n=1 Tax=Cotesia glomerata TaxID=32391 RepID=A0AAV7I9G9_COTGL|nr:hypothetical protein KQX54_018636 [Cotesia glomerata]
MGRERKSLKPGGRPHEPEKHIHRHCRTEPVKSRRRSYQLSDFRYFRVTLSFAIGLRKASRVRWVSRGNPERLSAFGITGVSLWKRFLF